MRSKENKNIDEEKGKKELQSKSSPKIIKERVLKGDSTPFIPSSTIKLESILSFEVIRHDIPIILLPTGDFILKNNLKK